ncbi:S8 family peptidase [Desertibacillus haloalkaliphilus]|uniref:S8 family peptidase n=1 Tax=Desertibacillus haloalkaliphilus TaxID=1328930 RepID=UPI001C280218|nr:S8 family serine peptidase [Desertibacillus haloalkaliphilus]MBU8905932.1 S8 family serine peptidase [Desertibacillus haloalkaliphilus]
MKTYNSYRLLLALTLAFLFLPLASHATVEETHVIIHFNDAIDDEVVMEHGGTILDTFTLIPALTASLTPESIIELEKLEAIHTIEEDAIVEVNQASVDWGVAKTNAPAVWDNEVTGEGVKVAVMDTGIATDHPDLEVAGGASFVSYTGDYDDDHGHGTHVAGILAANGQLIGMAPDVELYALKVLDDKGNGFHSGIIRALEWSVEHEVDLINLSMGGADYSSALEAAIDHAYNEGILIIAAAGNSGTANGEDTTTEYPANFDNVIAVAATDKDDQRADFSATGDAVEVAAPGVRVQSTHLNGDYKLISGTSMAAPHVTGHLALLKQARADVTNKELRELLHTQTIQLGTGERNNLYGYGRIELPTDLTVKEIKEPLVPVELSADVTAEKVTLNWLPTIDQEKVEAYIIYRDGKRVAKVEGEHTTYIEEIEPGTYTYEVKTVTVDHGEVISEPLTIEVVTPEPEPLEAPDFIDFNERAWYAPYMTALYHQDVIGGFEDETIRPNNEITRADATIMLVRALELNPTVNEQRFTDVSSAHYAASAIETAAAHELIAGYSDQTFQPSAEITRGEVAVILTRSFSLSPVEAPQRFTDVEATYFGSAAIELVTSATIATGYPDGMFQPQASVSRAEFSAFLARALEHEKSEHP